MKSIWLLTILVIISLCYYKNVNGEDCENDILGMNIECLIYMNKGLQEPISPNDRCCDKIKTANFPCVCKNGLSRKLRKFFFSHIYFLWEMLTSVRALVKSLKYYILFIKYLYEI